MSNLPPPPPPPPPGPEDAAGGADGPLDEPVEQAAFHLTQQTRTYPCRQCGAHLVFDITSQKLACDSCGFSADIDVSTLDRPQERDLRETMAWLHQVTGAPDARMSTDEKEIVCQNCGGHTTFTGTLTAKRCPYCTTPIQRDDIHQAPVRLAVDGVLPFSIDEVYAQALVEEWINSRRFAPRAFKRYRETGSFTSLYAAYFTYDAEVSTDYRGKRGDETGSGDNRMTRWRPASGRVWTSFNDETVLANDGFDRKRIRELEPWPTSKARPFSPEFVAGHLSRTYDWDAQVCFGEAKEIIDRRIDKVIRRDIGGDKQRIESVRSSYHSLLYKHLLLPIWLLTVMHQGKPFQVYLNGVTGEVQGQRPYSALKIVALVLAVVTVVLILFVLFGGSGSESG